MTTDKQRYVAKRRITLEVCLSSNLGAYEGASAPPLYFYGTGTRRQHRVQLLF
jgi:hypothetical protein